ncbi:MAG: SMC family ATPase, partial [Isosphaeraceae bacterium]|nr:SMC family ATPase [Isosphaeraceae bacterium]
MIPLRIRMEGFLCYREPQEVAFDGGSIWLLAGRNGSGKSAVFDAVTYALFGGHRGGKQNAEELINKDGERLVVEFDFLLGSEQYRIRRTLRRPNRSTRQVYRRDPEAADGWEAVPDTGNAAGFDAWIAAHVGLTFETFTASVLLRQGEAEKLLSSEPKKRFEVLAGIIDIDRYVRLHKRADALRAEREARRDALARQLEAIPEVDPADLEAARAQVEAARNAVETARAEVERLQRLAVQAEGWSDLQARLAETHRRRERAQALLAESEAIERQWGRLIELRAALPHLRIVIEGRARLGESEARCASLEARRRDLDEALTGLEAERDRLICERDDRLAAIAADEAREPAVAARLRELSGLIERLDLCDRQREERKRLDEALSQFPPDLPEHCQRLEQERDRLTDWERSLPHLVRLLEEREGLRAARDSARAAAEARPAAAATPA